MKIITENPYRIVGLLVGATAKEQEKQIKRLKQYLGADQKPTEDYSFPILGKIIRTVESVSIASGKLNLDNDRLAAALFWFFNGNEITDPAAFDSLKNSDEDRASEIWEKLIQTGEVTKKNFSAFNNLSTLLLCKSLNSKMIDEKNFEKAVILKMRYLDSEFAEKIKEKATDTTYATSKKEIQTIFIKSLLVAVNKKETASLILLVNAIHKSNVSTKEELVRLIVEKPINEIENLIEETRTKRSGKPELAGEYGKQLYQNTRDNYLILQEILDKSNIDLIGVSDRLANEILQCGITLFNHFHNTETEVGEITLELMQIASKIALGSVTKERISEQFPPVQEYINQKTIRISQIKVQKETEFISKEVDALQKSKVSVSGAIDFASKCKANLDSIKDKLGESDELFKTLSTFVVGSAMGIIVSSLNTAMKKRSDYVTFQNSSMLGLYNQGFDSIFGSKRYVEEYSFEEFQKVVNRGWDGMVFLKGFFMNAELRNAFNKNKEAIKDVYTKVNKGMFFVGDFRVYYAVLWIFAIALFLITISDCNK
ncbi:hypothetical protein [Ignavibacterium album]|uniref:hypothetical protein n=1 Tax=Ignavibacterium album TaxID=591197 RepID=UPI0035BAE673